MELTLTDHEAERVADSSTPKSQRTGGKLLEQYRSEMDSAYVKMRNFPQAESDEIFKDLAGFTARFSHIRSQIVRVESRNWQNFRTKEVDPFLDECDRQFKIWSRVFSVKTLDWEMTKGV